MTAVETNPSLRVVRAGPSGMPDLRRRGAAPALYVVPQDPAGVAPQVAVSLPAASRPEPGSLFGPLVRCGLGLVVWGFALYGVWSALP